MATASLAAIAGADTTMGNKKVKFRTLTGPSSYTTAGDTIAPSDVGLRKISAIVATNAAVVPGTLTGAFMAGFSPVASSTSWKVNFYTAAGSPGTTTALGEVASTTNLSTYKATVMIFGY